MPEYAVCEHRGSNQAARLLSPAANTSEALLLREGWLGGRRVFWDTRYGLPRTKGSCTLCFVTFPGFLRLVIVMQRHNQCDDNRIADNLRRTIELTELGLALRQSVLLQQGGSDGDAMAQVMREVRRAKELAWRLSPS